jgi:hypothetical protein
VPACWLGRTLCEERVRTLPLARCDGGPAGLNHPGGCERNEIAPIMNNSTLFLGRDGVINVDRGYVYRPEQFDFVAGIFELARFWTNELRRPIVVVTNQSSAGRGPIHLVERRSSARRP